ncbi:hypothetical protein L7F22_026183 [Adiantum nelumboides]|nr:hypothetical protein [Adiantum nelumboides]
MASMEALAMARPSTDAAVTAASAKEHCYALQACSRRLSSVSPSPKGTLPSMLRSPFLCSTTSLQGKAAPCIRAGSGKLWSSQVSCSLLGEDPEWNDDDYLAVGLSHCFELEEGVLKDVFLIEPVQASSLECLENGGATSFLHVTGSTLGIALKCDASLLPSEFSSGRFCNQFEFRAKCCARTWKRPHAVSSLMSILPVGALHSEYNFSLADKRVINKERVVTDSDNIKQDMSIDVYGRNSETDTKEEQNAEIASLYNV